MKPRKLGGRGSASRSIRGRDRWPSRVSGAGLATVTAWEGARVFQRSAACRKEMKDLKGAARRRAICLIGQRSVYWGRMNEFGSPSNGGDVQNGVVGEEDKV